MIELPRNIMLAYICTISFWFEICKARNFWDLCGGSANLFCTIWSQARLGEKNAIAKELTTRDAIQIPEYRICDVLTTGREGDDASLAIPAREVEIETISNQGSRFIAKFCNAPWSSLCIASDRAVAFEVKEVNRSSCFLLSLFKTKEIFSRTLINLARPPPPLLRRL